MNEPPRSDMSLDQALERLIRYLIAHGCAQGTNITRDDVYAALQTSSSDRSRAEKRFLTRIEEFLSSPNRGETELWNSIPHEDWTYFSGLVLEPLRSRLGEIGRARAARERLDALNLDCRAPVAFSHAHSFSLIGVGALNLDHIVLREHWASVGDEQEVGFARCFDDKGERQCDEEEFERAMKQAGEKPLKQELGGSAFNVISTIRAAAPPLALGYLGARGDDAEGNTFAHWFGQNDVTPLVYSLPRRRTARCLSYMVPIDNRLERRLLTTRGANTALVDFIIRDLRSVADTLARARIIHISSIFDERAPTVLVELVAAVRARNANIIISIDPGEDWARDASKAPGLWTLFGQADFLFCNTDEFRMLGGQIGSDETVAAQSALERCTNPAALLIVKHRDATAIFVRNGEDVERLFFQHDTIEDARIGDATGSGDCFAAGYLLGVLSGEFRVRDCAALGAAFAGRRLTAGRSHQPSFSEIYANLRSSLRKS